MSRGRLVVAAVVVSCVVGCGPNEAAVEDFADDEAEVGQALGVMRVNECKPGSGGYLELVNTSTATVDLAQAAGSCWFVDDVVGGASPVQLTDTNVRHAPTATWCAAAGRRSTCALVGPGERVWVTYSGVNATSIDECRLLSAPVVNGACGAQVNEQVGGISRGGSGCAGRLPDTTGSWHSGPIDCTPLGAKNEGGFPQLKLVINEFKPGTGGWVELFNASSTDRVNLAGWLVDDVAGAGAAPKALPEGTVLAPRSRLVVPFGGINTASPDEVRLVHPSGVVVDSRANGYAGSTITGKCFGRSPDGEGWMAAALPCTPDAANAATACPGGTYAGVAFTAAEECAAVRYLNHAAPSELAWVMPGNITLDCGPGGTCSTTRQRAWTRLDQLLAFRNAGTCGEGTTTAMTRLKARVALTDASTPQRDTVASLWASRTTLANRQVTLEGVVTAVVGGLPYGKNCAVLRDTASGSAWLTVCEHFNPYIDGFENGFIVGQRFWLRGMFKYDQYLAGGRWVIQQLEPRVTGPASSQCGLGTWRVPLP